MSRPLGFNDTYAIGMREEVAARLGIVSLSDLQRHPELRFGFSNEFMDRADGWPGCATSIAFRSATCAGLDHDLAYRALASGEIQATDLYSTDAEIRQYKLRVLRDDLGCFPAYECCLALPCRPAEQIAGRSSTALATAGGADLELRNGRDERAGQARQGARGPGRGATSSPRPFGITAERQVTEGTISPADCWHGWRASRSGGDLAGGGDRGRDPAGHLAARRPRLGQVILTVVGVIQTIPSLALLVFMIPWLGIGAKPAAGGACFSTACCRSCATRPPACATSRRRSASRPRRWALPPGASCGSIELPTGLAGDPGRHQDGRGHQRGHGHDRRLDRRRRLRPADPHGHPPRRHAA